MTRLALARFVAAAWLGKLRGPLAAPALALASLGGGRSERLLIAPRDIRTADPIAAENIYAGHFALAGKSVTTHGHSIFGVAPPSRAWSEELHGFGWLRHLRAAETPLARLNARSLVEDWLDADAHGFADRGSARAHPVVARRLLSWLSHSPIILEGADLAFYKRFLRAIERHAAILERALAAGLDVNARPAALIALTQAGLCLDGARGLLRRASLRLSRELTDQILGDGGHVSRDPRALVDLLVDLLPTRQAFVARGVAPPDPVLNAIDRMIPMLRMFRHADGALALFNGMGVSEPETLATLLAHGDAGGAAILDAPYSGYQRMDCAASIVIVDVGAPPPPEFSREAHAGCLAFEFSTGFDRLIVNCGAPREAGEARQAARATAAHSTGILDDHSSCRLVPLKPRSLIAGMALEGPTRVEARRWVDDAGAQWIESRHDGYGRRYGVAHARKLSLSRDGAVLHGEDRLAPLREGARIAAAPFVIRFHLHPDVRASAPSPEQVALTLPSGEEWLFEAAGREIELSESIFFAAPSGARPTLQMVLRAGQNAGEMISWRLGRAVVARAPRAPPSP